MHILTENLGKQYNGEWIFKSISLSFFSEFAYHISGSNGSGKSTLLRVLAGYSVPSKGKLNYFNQTEELKKDLLFENVSFCSPALSLFDNHTVKEAIAFHFTFKKLNSDYTLDEVLDFCYLRNSAQKKIAQLSSGMIQRLKLTLAFLSETSMLFLDEPCANLDEKAINWYQENLKKYRKNRLLLICSNNKEEEHFLCDKTIKLEDFKDL